MRFPRTRLKIRLPITLKNQDVDDEKTKLVNIGIGGICFETLQEYQTGDLIYIKKIKRESFLPKLEGQIVKARDSQHLKRLGYTLKRFWWKKLVSKFRRLIGKPTTIDPQLFAVKFMDKFKINQGSENKLKFEKKVPVGIIKEIASIINRKSIMDKEEFILNLKGRIGVEKTRKHLSNILGEIQFPQMPDLFFSNLILKQRRAHQWLTLEISVTLQCAFGIAISKGFIWSLEVLEIQHLGLIKSISELVSLFFVFGVVALTLAFGLWRILTEMIEAISG